MPIIHIFGDSHAMFFTQKSIIEVNNVKYEIHNKKLHSTSIRGLRNRSSRTGYFNEIIKDLQNISTDDIILLKFGQVDIECCYYYNKLVKLVDVSIQDYYTETIDIYKNFIKLLSNFNVIVASVNLPSISSNEYIVHYMNSVLFDLDVDNENKYACTIDKLSDIGDVYTRTNNCFLFNNMLKQLCDEEKLLFFDTTYAFLDTDTKLLKIHFTSKEDQHYVGSWDCWHRDTFTVFSKELTIFLNNNYDKLKSIS
jgi:hypothetical protein